VSTHETIELRLRVDILPTSGKLELKVIALVRPTVKAEW
jgi:hypothetical protein